MDIIFKDDMVKESKTWKNPMLLFFVLAVLFPLTLIWNNIKITEFILEEVFFLIVAEKGAVIPQYKTVGAAGADICAFVNEKIVLKTLFKNVEVQFKDIKTYNCKRYRKSEFYQFLVFCKEKKILINTRYKDDLEKLLDKVLDKYKDIKIVRWELSSKE